MRGIMKVIMACHKNPRQGKAKSYIMRGIMKVIMTCHKNPRQGKGKDRWTYQREDEKTKIRRRRETQVSREK